MSLFSKIIVALIALVAAYALWPRAGSLSGFDPQKCAAYELEAWKALRDGSTWKAALDFYKIYAFEFGASPIQSLNMARIRAGAIAAVLKTRDAAEQDKQIPDFVEASAILKRETGAGFDPASAGRTEQTIWALLSENASLDTLSKESAMLLASLFGLPEDKARKAGELRMAALRSAFSEPPGETRWDKVLAELSASWDLLHGAKVSGGAPGTPRGN